MCESCFDMAAYILLKSVPNVGYKTSRISKFVENLLLPKLKACSTMHVQSTFLSYSAKTFFPKIYTRTGDHGMSSTFTGERRSKDDALFEALGSTDELTSTIGLARDLLPEACSDVAKQLEEIQCILQDLSSAIATPKNAGKIHKARTHFRGEQIEQLEKWVDHYTEELPPLRNFILPSGGPGSSSLHVARAVCRRAERRLIPLVKDEEVEETVLKYLNRLSDYLFTVARVVAKENGKQETIYQRPKIRVPQDN